MDELELLVLLDHRVLLDKKDRREKEDLRDLLELLESQV